MTQVPEPLKLLVAKYRRRATGQEMHDENLDNTAVASIEVVLTELAQLQELTGYEPRGFVVDLRARFEDNVVWVRRDFIGSNLTEFALDLACMPELVSV